MTDKAREKIERCFTYHAPNGEHQVNIYNAIRNQAKAFAFYLVEVCQDSEELNLSLQKLSEAVFWANASIARNIVHGETCYECGIKIEKGLFCDKCKSRL